MFLGMQEVSHVHIGRGVALFSGHNYSKCSIYAGSFTFIAGYCWVLMGPGGSLMGPGGSWWVLAGSWWVLMGPDGS